MNTEYVQAKYSDVEVSRYSGNPFIEALPPMEQSKVNILLSFIYDPDISIAEIRKKGDMDRVMELSTLDSVVFPFPEYQNAAIALSVNIRDAYVARNPITTIDRQRRHALAANSGDGLPLPLNWKSSAKGHFLMAVSGMGKTTFLNSFLIRYPQVIEHSKYHDEPLICRQLVYLVLRIPHDATLKSLCIQFFDEVDRLLHTNYARQARAFRQIAVMVQLMNEVATAVSLGFLAFDEVQNLKSARGGNAEYVLNLFSEIIERLGISIVVIATPAVQSVLESSVRNIRKIASSGETFLRPMQRNDALWEEFCDTYWKYSFVRNKGALTKQVRNAWHDASGGNTACAALAFKLSQRHEIGGREIIDVASFERTAAKEMASLQPAIAALRSGDPNKLRMYDDLLFSSRYPDLRRQAGAIESAPSAMASEEFDDVEDVAKERPKRNSRKAAKSSAHSYGAFDPPREDPLSMELPS